jgi:hypothetical protein
VLAKATQPVWATKVGLSHKPVVLFD